MSDHIQAGMAEATRLTSEGRLAEATALIQRTLGGTFSPATSPDGPGGADGPIEASSRVVNETAHTTAPSRPDQKERALRPAPRPPRRFRGVPHRPGSLPGAAPGTTAGVPEPTEVSAGGQFVERS